jgi:adenosylhomocysteine nucleosidase
MRNRRVPIAAIVAALLALPFWGAALRSGPAAEARTAILGAFSEEVDRIEGMLAEPQDHTVMGMRFVSGKLNGRPVVVATSGVGKVNAAMVATLLIERFSPAEVLFTGIAGAIHPDLRPGDLVIGEKTAQHDLGNLTPEGFQLRGMRNPVDWDRNPVYLDADARLLALAESAAEHLEFPKVKAGDEERVPRVVRGIIVTGDVFVSSPAKKEELRKTMNASAVDMEGAAVAQICRQLGVPCLVIRGISDSAEANARQQAGMFLGAAVRNSALLVGEIARRLAGGKQL